MVDYARLLHHFIHALLSSIPGHKSGYVFPMSPQDKARGETLIDALQGTSQPTAIRALHEFIKPLLYPRPHLAQAQEYSKWDDVWERLLAIHALREDGNFKPADEITIVFAQLHYHMRGAILYEGLRNVDRFENDPYK